MNTKDTYIELYNDNVWTFVDEYVFDHEKLIAKACSMLRLNNFKKYTSTLE